MSYMFPVPTAIQDTDATVARVPDLNRLHPIAKGVPEKSSSYHAVATLNDDWRIIECRNGIQWILQRRRGHHAGEARWQGVSYCRSKIALLRCARSAGEITADARAILDGLPDWFE